MERDTGISDIGVAMPRSVPSRPSSPTTSWPSSRFRLSRRGSSPICVAVTLSSVSDCGKVIVSRERSIFLLTRGEEAGCDYRRKDASSLRLTAWGCDWKRTRPNTSFVSERR